MIDFISTLSSLLHTQSAEFTSCLLLVWCYFAITLFFLRYGRAGLLCYSVIAIIVADLQVLCAAHFHYYEHPLVLGTIVYSSLFLVNDLITERYGLQAAKDNILLTMFSHLLLIVFIILTLGYAPLEANPAYTFYHQSRQSLEQIFKPQGALFLASQIAYLLSQWTDVHIFAAMRKRLPSILALRSMVSVFFGLIVDTMIFNILAWEVLAVSPVPLKQLWTDYICANTMIQFSILIINVPVFYGILWLSRASFYRLRPAFSV